MIDKVKEIIGEIQGELKELNEYIYNNPELGYKENKACTAHTDLLKKHGFDIEKGYMDIETAFKGEFDSGKEGPVIAYLAEYDALPNIGHGCGHNILGTASTGAGIVLSKFLKDYGGKVIVFGTPAEETGGTKVDMANSNVFNNIDVAMIVHPSDRYYKSGKTLAMEAIEFTFKGRSAHASAEPYKGVNALDAAINTFNNINALREHIKSDARIHGVIIEGGKAANIIPDLAVAQFYVRAGEKDYLKDLVEKVKNCARGASLAAGTTLDIINYEKSYDNLNTNKALSERFTKRLYDMGVEKVYEAKESYGSTDAGNVSHVCPTIHPYFSISDKDVVGHTKDFADATIQPYAYEQMSNTIGASVLTALDIIQDNNLLELIKDEFKATAK